MSTTERNHARAARAMERAESRLLRALHAWETARATLRRYNAKADRAFVQRADTNVMQRLARSGSIDA